MVARTAVGLGPHRDGARRHTHRERDMKPLKGLGLPAMAAAVLFALASASTASATVLCKNNASTAICIIGTYGAGTEIKASLVSGNSKLSTPFKTVECSKSTISGKVENAGSSSSTVSGNLSSLTFSECNCEVKTLKNGSLELHQISGTDNGTATSTGAEITAQCSTIFGNVHCLYATEKTDLGTLVGGNPAKLEVKEANIPRLTTN